MYDSLFVVSDGELQMTGDDTVLLVIPGSIPSKFENFGCEIFQDGSKVYYCQIAS